MSIRLHGFAVRETSIDIATSPGLVITLLPGAAATVRPGHAQVALALARVMDSQKAVNQHAPAAKALTTVLDKLHSVGPQSRRGRLAVVRTLTERGGA
ncbi:MAG TPA: hypothetical protein VG327_18890 [Mycobacterium sp.]|jgi:hypothetical protein|nr:hypothetical protein [Mycobacterium sp.]